MLTEEQIESIKQAVRSINKGSDAEPALGPLEKLPGTTWKSNGMGWNMIALPFAAGRFGYRLLLNQYDETLNFQLVDKGVPNRGIDFDGSGGQTDQLVATLDYTQEISQVDAVDEPVSGEAGPADLPIHHEPGLWLHMINFNTENIDIARLSSIPHGDSVLALGTSETTQEPQIGNVNGLTTGVSQDLDSPYLEPYKHFHDNPFKGTVGGSFPGFDPVSPNDLLNLANQGKQFKCTTVLEVDTKIGSGGIHNIPFIVKEANAASMKSTFWISELVDGSLQLQYSQVVMLDFFNRRDGLPGLIGWPHVSINTLVPA